MDATFTFIIRGQKVHVMNFLKDPVDRVISEYKYLSSNRPFSWCDYATISYEPKSTRGFLFFLNDPVNAKGMMNRQTKMMAGCGMRNCKHVFSTDEAMLEKATCEIGISNIMDRSIRAMYRTFGYEVKLAVDAAKLQKGVCELNDGMALFDVDSHIVEKVVATNELDVKLYLYALQLFKERFESDSGE